MLRVTIQVTNISGERYWAPDNPLPSQVQIAVNINIVGLDQKNDSTAEAPFVFTVSYTPSIAQLSIKGKAQIFGDRTEVGQIMEDNKKNKPPPATVIQAVSSIAMADAIIMERIQIHNLETKSRTPKYWRGLISPKNWSTRNP